MSDLKVALIGAGEMSGHYLKVLNDMGIMPELVGRSREKVLGRASEYDCISHFGGVSCFDLRGKAITHAIVAVNPESLADCSRYLMENGVNNILIEKPGALAYSDILELKSQSDNLGADVFIAYNRRFYASVEKCREILIEDGGAQSFFMEFTEWDHVIRDLKESEFLKNNYVIANSSHVLDLAFYLCGFPKHLSSNVSGSLSWHTRAAVFSGSGVTDNGVLFSYLSNWSSAGRWGIEIHTAKRKIYLRPMERISVQMKGSLEIECVGLEDELDVKFKPGLYKQVKSFLDDKKMDLCTLEYQKRAWQVYEKIAGYSVS